MKAKNAQYANPGNKGGCKLATEAMLVFAVFLLTVLFILWRPRGINEAIPPAVGALLLCFFGIVSPADMKYVFGTVTGASITIISTIIMSIVLESMGFFRWVAFRLVAKCRGSGTILYWVVMLLCFCMTLFFNNDGSIVITTPIIIAIVRVLELKPHQKFPYLCSGAIIATASSAPIGVSNLANLIALKIVGVDLVTHTKYMFVPSMIGLSVISILLFIYFRNDIPKHIPTFSRAWKLLCRSNVGTPDHPLSNNKNGCDAMNWPMFRVYMTVIILVRVSLFILSNYGLPFEWAAAFGALVIILLRWYYQGTGPADVLQKTPWHIFVFAFSMYLVVYGLHNTGFTTLLIGLIKGPVSANLFNGIFIMGILLAVMSSLFNNLPSVMLGTLTLTQMGLEQQYLQLVYLANIIGSDIGSLILPSGTLASLIWMFMLRMNKIQVTWSQYIGVTLLVIPIALLVSLLSLYGWILYLA